MNNLSLHPRVTGLLQASGITIYVCLFATAVYISQGMAVTLPAEPVLGIIIFLLAFIISALICGSIGLARPSILFFEGKKREAFETVS